ncbi:MAG: sulfatase modifying factor 1 [Myxococcota bacterium]|jgi:sulfatase modifying factor 1
MTSFRKLWSLAAAVALLCGLGCSADETGETSADATECGATCEGMTRIEAGAFFMGSPDTEGRAREQPLHLVNFEEPYYIDTYEVTQGEFAQFLRAHGNGCSFQGQSIPCYDCADTPDLILDRKIECIEGWPLKSDCQSEPGGSHDQSCADHPATLVFWPGAAAFCEWKGKHLPSEAQWERAANGPGGPDASQWRRFPWGSDCPTLFNKKDLLEVCTGDAWAPSTAKANCEEPWCNDGFRWTAPVGSFPRGVSPEGVHDMSGNVMEWVMDCFHESFDTSEGHKAPDDGSAWLTDCDEKQKVASGGSAVDDGVNLRSAFRGGDPIDAPEADFDVGFRCAWTPPVP